MANSDAGTTVRTRKLRGGGPAGPGSTGGTMREAQGGTMKRTRPAARKSLAALPLVGERGFGMGGKRGRGDKE